MKDKDAGAPAVWVLAWTRWRSSPSVIPSCQPQVTGGAGGANVALSQCGFWTGWMRSLDDPSPDRVQSHDYNHDVKHTVPQAKRFNLDRLWDPKLFARGVGVVQREQISFKIFILTPGRHIIYR